MEHLAFGIAPRSLATVVAALACTALSGCGTPAMQDLSASAQKAVAAIGRIVPGTGKSPEESLVEKSPTSTGGRSRDTGAAAGGGGLMSSLVLSPSTSSSSSGKTGKLVLSGKTTISPDFTQTPEQVQAMLLRSNPEACSATSDASYEDIGKLYAALATNFAGMYVESSLVPDAQLKQKMKEFKPLLRELSRNTNWMPQSAERMVGEAIFKHNGYEDYQPNKKRAQKQLALIEGVVTPAFESMKAYARSEVKSDIEFELHIVRDEMNTAPRMIPGGLLIVPSGMLTALGDVPEADQIIAFMVAHEFSHALRRHRTKMTQLQLLDALTSLDQFKTLVGSTRTGLDRLKNPFDMMKFSLSSVEKVVNQSCKTADAFKAIEHNQEFEADVCGALLLRKFSESSKREYSAVRGFSSYLKNPSLHKPSPPTSDSCIAFPDHPAGKERLQKITTYEIKLDHAAK